MRCCDCKIRQGCPAYTNDMTGFAKCAILEKIEALEAQLAESQGRERAAIKDLEKFQVPMLVVQEAYTPSTCPRCNERYYDYEECADGYYQRAYSLWRCPYCGQKIKWE